MSIKNDPIAHLDDQRVWDCFLGSGALSYAWWISAVTRGERVLDLGFELVDSRGTGRSSGLVRLTPDVLRTALRDLLGSEDTCYTVAALDWTDEEVDCDVDADVADCVLQQAAYGRVVFG